MEGSQLPEMPEMLENCSDGPECPDPPPEESREGPLSLPFFVPPCGQKRAAPTSSMSLTFSLEELETRPPVKNKFPHPLRKVQKQLMVKGRSAYLSAKNLTPRSVLETVLPCCGWLPKYNWKEWLLSDFAAALVITLMAIPQAMSYANLAALPAVFGMYGMVSPVIVYGVIGSSKQLGVGPVAVTSMLLGHGISSIYGSNINPNAPADPELQMRINEAAIQVGLLAGMLYTTVGVLGQDWIANFLSHSVISGFMTGAAVLIALSQVKYLLGIKLPRADDVISNVVQINTHIGEFKWTEFAMGMSWLCVILGLRCVAAKWPRFALVKTAGPILVTFLSLILLSYTNWATEKKIAVVGFIPPGLPRVTISWWHITDHFSEKLTLAALICGMDLCESLAIAKALAQKNRDEINQRQEIVALGLANLVGASFNCYTTTGSFSRSAVAQSMGAKSQLVGLMTGTLMIIVLSTLTPLLSNLPQNIQGAVVIASVIPLLDFREAMYLFGVDLRDWCVWMVTCFGTMLLGVEIGIAVGVALSILLVLFEVSFPNIVELGQIESSRVYRSTKFYPEAKLQPGICVIRIDSSIIFANFAQLRREIRLRIQSNQDAIEAATAAQCAPPVRLHTLILDLSAATYMDASSVHLFRDLVNELQAGGRVAGPVRLLFTNPTNKVLRIMMRGKFLGENGSPDHHFFLAVHEAVTWAKRNEMLVEPSEKKKNEPSVGFRALEVGSDVIEAHEAWHFLGRKRTARE